MSRIEELKAEEAKAKAAAAVAALSEEEAEEAALLVRIAEAQAEAAAAAKTRRGIDLAARERAARAKVSPRVLVRGIDLLDLFPLGHAPDAEALPGKGVIVVRSAPAEVLRTFHREAEAKERSLADIYADVLCASTIDPDEKDLVEGALLRAFCEAYPGAAIGGGEIAVRLGGSKIKADKRGRS